MNTSLPIRNENEITIAIHKCKILAKSLGFDDYSISFITASIAEIAINAVRYGVNGRIYYSPTYNNLGLRIIIIDTGKGISNIKLSLKDNYSSSLNSLGVGLGAARRAMNNFWIKSQINKGTIVLMKKHLPIDKNIISWGLAHSINKNEFNFIEQEFDGDKLLLGLIKSQSLDNKASDISQHLKSIVIENVGSSLNRLLGLVQQYLINNTENHDFEVCLCYIKPNSFSFTGVGKFYFGLNNENNIRFATSSDSLWNSNINEIATFQFNTKNKAIGIISTNPINEEVLFDNLFSINNNKLAYKLLSKKKNDSSNFVIVSKKNS